MLSQLVFVDSDQKLTRTFDPDGKFLYDITHESLQCPTVIATGKENRIYIIAHALNVRVAICQPVNAGAQDNFPPPPPEKPGTLK